MPLFPMLKSMNGFLLLLLAIADLSFVFFCWYLGEEWVYASIVVNMLLIVCFAQKLITIFGFMTNAGNVFYAATFLAMGIIIENKGATRAYKMVWLGLVVLMTFILFSQIVLGMETASSSLAISRSMNSLFSASPRVALASFLGYSLSQTFNIWCYDFIRKKTGDGYLWFRKNVSTWFAQIVDSVIFFSIVFAGVVDFTSVLQIMIVGLIVKIVVAILDTPFLYLSRVIRPLEE